MKFPTLLGVLCLFAFSGFSQVNELTAPSEQYMDQAAAHEASHAQCGTVEPTPEQYAYTRDVIANIDLPDNTGTTAVPLRIYIVTDGTGNGGVSTEALNQGLANLNLHFLNAGIEYYFTSDSPVFLDDADYYTFDETAPDNDTENGLVAAAGGQVTDAANVYFVNSITTSSGFAACGYAYFPFASDVSLRILMANSCTVNADNGTFVHELGHWFNLYHTHQDTGNGNTDPDAENVPRTGSDANCTMAGDLICDTPADPNGSNDGSCNFINDGNSSQDINGVTYTPDVGDIMSYYSDYCGGMFTAGQNIRMAQGLITRQSNHTLNRPWASVVAVSGLTATENTNTYSVDLSWTDNAGNEMGYIIERSTTSSSSGFSAMQMSGVDANVTNWSDTDLQSNTTYWYRIKASNGDPNTYSNVATVTTGLLYCVPTHHSGSCTIGGIGMGIDDFTLEETDGTDLIANLSNGCSNTFTNYKSTYIGNVTAGTDYAVIIALPTTSGSYYPQNIKIYIDANQDGDYDDFGEKVVDATGFGSTFNASDGNTFTIPATALNGTTTMRVRVFNSGSSADSPCGYASYGETEEYGLIVSGAALPVEFISFAAKAKEQQVQLDWTTASEINNDYFVIQRSTDAKSFVEIGKVTGSGTSDVELNYQFMDSRPALGENYYRLKQVNFAGTYDYSEVKVVDFKADFTAHVFPNPIQNSQITLDFNSLTAGEVVFEVRDIQGRLLQTEQFWIEKGQEQHQVQLADLPKGMYLLRLQKNQSVQTIRLLNN